MRHPSVHKKRRKKRAQKRKTTRWLNLMRSIRYDLHAGKYYLDAELIEKEDYTMQEIVRFIHEEFGDCRISIALYYKEYPLPDFRKIRE